MTKKQAQWARQHDWYVSYNMRRVSHRDSTKTYSVCVIERTSGEKDSLRSFDNFEELTRWAGY